MLQAVADRIYGKQRRLFCINGHALLQRRKWLEAFGSGVEFPIGRGTAVVGDDRIALVDAAVAVEVAQLAALAFIAGVYPLHEVQDVGLPVAIGRYGGSDGKD